jgi:ferredoxin
MTTSTPPCNPLSPQQVWARGTTPADGPGPWFVVDGGQTVLAAAERAGVAWPSSCRNGSCRTCLSRLVAGRVQHTIAWPSLSPDERAEGYVLPCVARACPGAALELRCEGLVWWR